MTELVFWVTCDQQNQLAINKTNQQPTKPTNNQQDQQQSTQLICYTPQQQPTTQPTNTPYTQVV